MRLGSPSPVADELSKAQRGGRELFWAPWLIGAELGHGLVLLILDFMLLTTTLDCQAPPVLFMSHQKIVPDNPVVLEKLPCKPNTADSKCEKRNKNKTCLSIGGIFDFLLCLRSLEQ